MGEDFYFSMQASPAALSSSLHPPPPPLPPLDVERELLRHEKSRVQWLIVKRYLLNSGEGGGNWATRFLTSLKAHEETEGLLFPGRQSKTHFYERAACLGSSGIYRAKMTRSPDSTGPDHRSSLIIKGRSACFSRHAVVA